MKGKVSATKKAEMEIHGEAEDKNTAYAAEMCHKCPHGHFQGTRCHSCPCKG